MTEFLRRLYGLFDSREQRRLVWIFLCMVAAALLSTGGVAAILPFMSLVADPAAVHENRWLLIVYERLGFRSPLDFLFLVGLGTLLLLVLTNALTAFTGYMILRFVRNTQHRLSKRLLAQYLSEPYAFFLNRNTAKLSKNILSEVNSVVNGVLVPAMQGLASLVVAVCILALLLAVHVRLALLVAATLGAAYLVIYVVVRRRQAYLGGERLTANMLRYKIANEAFGGIKEVKVLGRERHFVDRFHWPSKRFAEALASNAMIGQLPRFALETVAFGGILIIVLYLLRSGYELTRVLPVMSLYAFAGYRLMPALQQVFIAGTQMRFNAAALDELYEDLHRVGGGTPAGLGSGAAGPDGPPIVIQDEVRLEDVWFTYPEAREPVLREVNARFPKNTVIGVVGPTGSGKTTLVDLLLGLYSPQRGHLVVDGQALSEADLPHWRAQIGYVPQSIFLSDDSVRNNIAFGVPEPDIDDAAVQHAARVAQIHEFVATLPRAYDTLVGERGVRLSGGQRQRIGIARALYHDPAVLVMDEATSALDGATEDALMDAVHQLAGQKTMILIAHRITTVRDCDLIYLMQEGRVVASGDYQHLLRTNAVFRAIAGQEPASAMVSEVAP